MSKLNIVCYVDGGYDNVRKANPYGSFVVFEETNSEPIYFVSRTSLNKAKSSNEAEYSILIELLKYIFKHREIISSVLVFSDSSLVVNQVNGKWKVSADNLKPLHKIVKKYLQKIQIPVIIIWIKRDTIVRILGH